MPGIEIIEDRGDERVLAALHALWGRHGVLRRIQFDNGGPFISPTGIGEVVRVCLHQGATPVFVPPREPWRNATIEHFDDTFDKRFFRKERFSDLVHLSERAGAFERFHNAHHRYSATRGRTPDETAITTKRAPRQPAGWPDRGKVELIRFIRSDQKLRILGRAIPIPDGSAYPYVTAARDLSLPAGEQNLLVCDDRGELLPTSRLSTPAR